MVKDDTAWDIPFRTCAFNRDTGQLRNGRLRSEPSQGAHDVEAMWSCFDAMYPLDLKIAIILGCFAVHKDPSKCGFRGYCDWIIAGHAALQLVYFTDGPKLSASFKLSEAFLFISSSVFFVFHFCASNEGSDQHHAVRSCLWLTVRGIWGSKSPHHRVIVWNQIGWTYLLVWFFHSPPLVSSTMRRPRIITF